MNNKNINAILSLAILCFVAFGCSLVTEGKPEAERAVVQFHDLLNAEKYGEIYETSHKYMKDATSEDDMVKLLTAVHTKLGAVKSSAMQSWQVGNYNLVSTVVLVQETEFENGKGTETFTFVIEDKKATLGGYNINSMELITR
ncbi:MAG TPA: DUF3887 domain-containing protein [Pyrinomonadaceae bacterium]|jgi:hypothetical protein|nr:DUF3887 domain-containing protein [Pyrinomonadaceae bacterium]